MSGNVEAYNQLGLLLGERVRVVLTPKNGRRRSITGTVQELGDRYVMIESTSGLRRMVEPHEVVEVNRT